MSAGNMNKKNYLAQTKQLLAGSEFYRNSVDPKNGREYTIVHANTAVRWYADGYAEPYDSTVLLGVCRQEALKILAAIGIMDGQPSDMKDVRLLYEAVAHAHNAIKKHVGFCYITEKGKQLAAEKD